MYEDEIPVGRAKNITGQRFGRWTVLYRTPNQGKRVMWKCRCDCGNEKNVIAASLGKSSNSCGCLQKEQVAERSKKLYTIDITGQKFGRLTVLKMVDRPEEKEGKNGTGAWCECKCECGNTIITKASWLKTKGVQSCGCLRREISVQNSRNSVVDLTNMRFGRLIALYPTEERVRSGSIVWHCICDCGEEKDVASTDLVQNKTHSCGKCGYQAEMTSKDLLGQIFGRLTVIEKTNNRSSNGSIIWKCQCECGNIVEIPTNALTSAHTMSCGCLQSKGEYDITKLLNAHQIPYEPQKKFASCRFPDTNAQAKFDFYISEDNYLIEYDGQQHFYPIDHFGGDKQFVIQQQRDEYKNQWCKENNIPLIRIPYTKLDTLCIEDLMLETTQFRVV